MAYKYIVEKKGRKFVVVDSGHMTTPHGPYTTEREAQKTADYLRLSADKSENDRLAFRMNGERAQPCPQVSTRRLTQPAGSTMPYSDQRGARRARSLPLRRPEGHSVRLRCTTEDVEWLNHMRSTARARKVRRGHSGARKGYRL